MFQEQIRARHILIVKTIVMDYRSVQLFTNEVGLAIVHISKKKKFMCTEKSFFNDVSSAHLQKGHPLAHLATSFRSIQQHPPGGFDKSSNAHTLNPYSNQPNLNKVFATKSVRDEKGNQRMQRDFLLNSSSKHHREFLLSTCVLGSISTCVAYL